MPWGDALATTRRLAGGQAAANGFEVLEESFLMYMADKGMYLYILRTERDPWDKDGATTLVFDGSGTVRSLFVPTGSNAGSTLHSWIFALHMAKVWACRSASSSRWWGSSSRCCHSLEPTSGGRNDARAGGVMAARHDRLDAQRLRPFDGRGPDRRQAAGKAAGLDDGQERLPHGCVQDRAVRQSEGEMTR